MKALRSLLTASILLIACGAPRPVDPPPRDIRDQQNKAIQLAILESAKDGDWLTARGYHHGDKFVMTVTRTPISHAAVLDLAHQQVVESLADGVQITSLKDFIDKSHRVMLIRPIWSEKDPDAGPRALAAARGYVGRKYDYLGTIGIDNKKRFYCSELVFQSYAEFFDDHQDIPRFIEPDQLYLWGTILYDSRPRNEW
jgi:uncharacterized protein YycO